jgi:N4-gp56 family major capsid protein
MATSGLGGGAGWLNPNISSGSIANEVMTYYEKVFLKRADYELVMKEGAQLRTHPSNNGRTVNFTRRTPATIVTDPIAELSNPSTCVVDSCTVSMTLSEFGLTTVTSKLATLIGIDSRMKETVEMWGANMGQTLNRLTRDELMNGTSYYGNDHGITSFAAGDTLDACDIRMIVKKLELAKAPAYPDGLYIGKTDPISKLNLLGDSTWIAAKEYSDVQGLYKGEMGELYQVRWLLNKDYACGTEAGASAASAVVRFYTYIHGSDSFGCYDLEGDQPKLYILPNAVDSGSPAGRVSFVSWAGSYATKILNSNWVITCRFAVT